MLTKIKTVLTKVIPVPGLKRATAKESLLYQGQTMSGLTKVTQDVDGIRTLRFGQHGPRQSVVRIGDLNYLGLPYAKSAMIGLAFTQQLDRILVLGVGAGNIPMFLRKHDSDAQIDVIDIDPQIIALAKQYFNFLEDDLLKAYVQDGRAFIENVQKPYDLIFLDAYTAAGIPKHLATKEFLLSLKKALKPSGAIIANMWSTPKVNPLYRSMLRTYQEVFHEVYTLRVPTAGNKIVIALPQFRGLPLNSIAQRAQEISVQKRLPFELSEVLQPGLIKLIDLQESQVLLDGGQ
ncbi:fused MFS/spermidine synthase [Polynucleobacter sp. JS-Mosq-20-D10]|uniref:spermidine synthase n=1 Tax=Polynucleobacter sp. JS-Mosq-20-D10 TaxID=2576922 RepID=UPI001BFEBF76|nr:fused MFS/spermidine synthase [Polynucleobacter sp. JS-Mosq-20-D10]QWE00931.1 fused MFS/spermidine synthase [Polynucleobacter sp. JS-Mosq-20-D10]